MSRYCPNCFAELQTAAICPTCGYVYDNACQDSTVLPPMTVLKERYLLGRTLGIGGFGVTYLAMDLRTGQKRAVKEYMPAELAVRDRNGNVCPSSVDNEEIFDHCKQGFFNEARTLFTFSGDPTIVNVLDYFTEKNTAFLVMEYLDGCNMKSKMRNMGGVIPVEMATVMLVSIGSALMAVHKKNILHRDISPENIFITENGEFKLIDFGASRFFTSQENKSLSILLKPGFAPPEQYSTKGNQGPWTDVYALAATYYYLVSGVKPIDTMDRLSGKEMPTLNEVCPQVSLQTARAVSHAMEVNYAHRYQNVLSFLDDIDTSCIGSMETQPLPAAPVPVQEKRRKPLFKTQRMQKGKTQASKAGAVVVCFCGTEREYEFNLIPDRQIKIGRGNSAEIQVSNDINISRLHCSLIYNSEKKKVFLQDHSSNGTFFADGERLARNVPYEANRPFYLLQPGNTFQVIVR